MLNRNLRLSININIGRWIKQGSLAILGSFFLPAPSAVARDFLENTSMLDMRMGSSRSAIARNLSIGGYELSDGTPVSFADWYMPHFPEMSLLFLTQINPSLGITWGISTGERGEKYRIDPGVWLGLVYRMQLSKHSGLTFFATTLIGGDFRELACRGDYKEIGGLQKVNCRLAASVIPPSETLNFLIKERGFSETRLSMRYEIRF